MLPVFALWCCVVLQALVPAAHAAENVSRLPQRAMAVTFDDLPFVAGGRQDPELSALSAKLQQQITDSGIPAVGFVNEAKLYSQGGLDSQRVAILEKWLAAGLELGNHTYSHPSLNRIPLADFERDVVLGETITKKLMAERNLPLRYFRHPFLHVGKDTETRVAFEKFLTEHGYTIAPVTINSAEWVFAAAYDKASQQRDEAAVRQVAEAYVPYMEQMVTNAEKQSLYLFGYEIKQVLLLHANALNAEHLGELVAMLKRRGYTFITLDEALQDRAYRSPNTYAGMDGASWLDQWGVSVGLRQKQDVKIPVFVRGLAGRAAYFGY